MLSRSASMIWSPFVRHFQQTLHDPSDQNTLFWRYWSFGRNPDAGGVQKITLFKPCHRVRACPRKFWFWPRSNRRRNRRGHRFGGREENGLGRRKPNIHHPLFTEDEFKDIPSPDSHRLTSSRAKIIDLNEVEWNNLITVRSPLLPDVTEPL